MKCLVLGGGGFIGSHVCDVLVSAGHDVRIFEKEHVSKENIEHLISSVEWVEGDFTNQTHLKEIVKGVDIIIHSIGTTHPRTSNENPVYDISSNLISTLYLLESARDSGVRKVIFFSSGGTVYGIPQTIPIPEDHPTEPICSYGIQKLAIEKYIKLFYHLYGLDYAIMRISNPYGERQRPHALQGAVAVFMNKALNGEEIEIWGDGSVTRDYLHIRDVARAVLLLTDYSGCNKLFNIGGGHGYSLLDMIRIIEKVINHPVKVRFMPARPFDVPVNVLDITRARDIIKWRPEIGLEEGLQRTMSYLSEHS